VKKIDKKSLKKIVTIAGKYLAFLFLFGFLTLLILFIYYTHDLPRPEKFTETKFIQSTKIYDRTGETLLFDIYGEEKREIVSFEKISDNLKNAVLSSEDTRFYQHSGIDITGIIRAILVDLKLQTPSQGASTITQQLVRSVYLTKQKTISRKVKEIILSIELEKKYSKDQIFDWYLNAVPFGENAYGAEAASRTYFNKPASALSLAESAILAGLLPAPSRLSPYGSNKAELFQRKNIILEKMNRLGYITQEQLEEAKNEKLEFAEFRAPIKAPDFVFYVKKYLDNKYGADYLKEKGLRVYTSLDWEIQEFVEQVAKESDQINRNKNSHNIAVVVTNPKTGEILSLVGSKDYFAKAYPEGCDEKPGNTCLFEPRYDVATMGQRQPGSAFKPFVYAAAFKKGFTPNTIVWDVKTEFNPNCDPNGNSVINIYGQRCYNPQNYDGTTRGPVALKTALGSSLNIPSVKTLYLAGIPESLKTAQDFGMTTLTDINRYGLSLVLGGGEVNLLEMTSAYGVFAAEGMHYSPISILKIEDAQGNIIEENNPSPKRVLDTQIARQINNILSDDANRAPVFGYNSLLNVPGYDVAAKTGTTQNFVDGWTMGYTPFASVGVWTGNNNNTPTRDSGVGVAAPIWRKIIDKIISLNAPETFTPPDSITDKNPVLLGQIPPGDINTILYYIDKENPTGSAPQNPAKDPQYLLWQIGINNWLIQTGRQIELDKEEELLENSNDNETNITPEN
jgi:1A family penicillin-binding protein